MGHVIADRMPEIATPQGAEITRPAHIVVTKQQNAEMRAVYHAPAIHGPVGRMPGVLGGRESPMRTDRLRFIVIAESLSIGAREAEHLDLNVAAIVTPQRPDAARGVTADRIAELGPILNPTTRERLLREVQPCIATARA